MCIEIREENIHCTRINTRCRTIWRRTTLSTDKAQLYTRQQVTYLHIPQRTTSKSTCLAMLERFIWFRGSSAWCICFTTQPNHRLSYTDNIHKSHPAYCTGAVSSNSLKCSANTTPVRELQSWTLQCQDHVPWISQYVCRLRATMCNQQHTTPNIRHPTCQQRSCSCRVRRSQQNLSHAKLYRYEWYIFSTCSEDALMTCTKKLALQRQLKHELSQLKSL